MKLLSKMGNDIKILNKKCHNHKRLQNRLSKRVFYNSLIYWFYITPFNQTVALQITNYQLPITNYQLPITNSL